MTDARLTTPGRGSHFEMKISFSAFDKDLKSAVPTVRLRSLAKASVKPVANARNPARAEGALPPSERARAARREAAAAAAGDALGKREFLASG
ncbi:MAG: hypothetical protein IRZ09_00185 [Variibacter sp.]|nr:hypothetical protein [Variibacter sp.]